MMLEEEVEVPVIALRQQPNESVRMDIDEAANDSSNTETDANMEDAKTSDWLDNRVPESVEKPVQMETDNKVLSLIRLKLGKRRSRKLMFLLWSWFMVVCQPKNYRRRGGEMALQDRVMEETEDKKMLWRHVYDMRNKLYNKYEAFATSSEKDEMIAKLQEVEDWLYEDGEDETKGVYVDKLEELQKQGNPIEERYKEWIDRGPATNQLVYCINSLQGAALSNDPKSDRFDIEEQQKAHHFMAKVDFAVGI
ncbi:hypothetical protein ZIOFF_006820 [Zingiber officinale]|uniref:Uncharacterized protein n=1 Tax=Zingiber officinale TaxID=94328 RepID=A0A8J5LPD5_ZINOF|nr:hypothetical protein ZIOFF_006820 [Zingiber officinale]